MRGNTLINLRLMLKGECGMNLSPGVATGEDTRFNSQLSTMQQWLWSQHQWPFLYGHDDIAITPLQRFYPLPPTISTDYPTQWEVKWNNLWYDVENGIKGEQYEEVDPDLGQTLDPVMRWQNYNTPQGAQQIEVWPMPATVQTLRVWGTRTCSTLSADQDVAVLDDLLIVLFTAAQIQAKAKQRDAQALAGRAEKLWLKLVGQNRPDMCFVLGGEHDIPRQTTRVVGIVGNPNK